MLICNNDDIQIVIGKPTHFFAVIIKNFSYCRSG
jgi:hypothetical protein